MQPAKHLIIGILALLGGYTLLRISFWFWHGSLFADITVSELTWTTIQGLRFDLAAIAFSSLPVALGYLAYVLTGLQPLLLRLCRGLFWVSQTFFFGVNLFDLEYFTFTGKRLTLSSFALQDDLGHQLGQILVYYWGFSLIMMGLILVVIKLSPWCVPKLHRRPRWQYVSLATVILIVSLGLAARGGWQTKPLIPAHAFAHSQPELGHLALNSSFTFIKSIGKDREVKLKLLADWQAVEQTLEPFYQASPTTAQPDESRPNVVLIILESFSREYMGLGHSYQGYTPFLDQLASQGTFYQGHVANGRRSIDAVPSILAGIPAWMDQPFITSPYQTNRVAALPQILHDHGYATRFFHGGYPGTMFFNVMSRLLGFKQYIDADDVPAPYAEHSSWGVYDEPFLQFVADDLTDLPQPFFATVFTLSSHHPYEVPSKYQGRFPKGSLEIHESIGYADHALAEFFATIQQTEWYDNTVFILTADHTSKSDQSRYQTPIGHFRVPLVFFRPGRQLPLVAADEPAQHIDIKPTVLDLLGIREPERSLQGQSLVTSPTTPRLALLYGGPVFWGLTSQYLLRYHRVQRRLEFFARDDEHFKHPLTVSRRQRVVWRQRIEAYIQAYHNGLIDNRFVRSNHHSPRPTSQSETTLPQ